MDKLKTTQPVRLKALKKQGFQKTLDKLDRLYVTSYIQNKKKINFS
jgi:hypothetical protein